MTINKKKSFFSIILVIITLVIIIIALFIKFSSKNESLAVNAEEKNILTYEKADVKDYNIEEIIKNNTSTPIKEEMVSEEVDLEYTTKYQETDSISKGKVQVIQEGRDGKQKVITKKVYKGNELVREEQTGSTVTVAAIDKIVQIGTGSESSTHQVKKDDEMYVTSYTLNMFLERNKDSNKITTLSKGQKVKVVEVDEQWIRVSYNTYVGWVDANCLEYREEKNEQNESKKNNINILITNTTEKNKEQLQSTLSENMKLNKPSGLTLEQFKKVLENNENDKNGVFAKNAEYFYYIENQYNINGLFVAAVGIHESAWGTSKISIDKKNLFGYGANDSNPYDNAYSFASYSEGIDLLARVFVKYYLNPSGTKIYENEIASGKYYSGDTLADVNKKYATDKNWNKSVYKWMNYLYNKL